MGHTDKLIKDSLKALNIENLGDQFVNSSSLENIELVTRLGINLVSIFILVRVIYYTTHRNKDFVFTFFIFNLLNFLICVLLSTTKIKIGFAFGLFAIFSILRYRTVMVPIKEMGYFFVCVAIGIINALATVDDNYWVLIGCNIIIIALITILDKFVSLSHENVKEIIYERIDLITPERRDQLIEDLKIRTGLPIHRVEIKNINFLRDTARVHVFYIAQTNENTLGLDDDDD